MRKLHKTDGSRAETISPAFYSLHVLRSYFSELYKNQINWAPRYFQLGQLARHLRYSSAPLVIIYI